VHNECHADDLEGCRNRFLPGRAAAAIACNTLALVHGRTRIIDAQPQSRLLLHFPIARHHEIQIEGTGGLRVTRAGNSADG
jgi:hypothetical protein